MSRFIDIRCLVPEWQGRELEKSSSLAKNDEVDFFCDLRGLSAPEGLAISRIFIHRSVQLKTLIQLVKFDLSSLLCLRDVDLQIWYLDTALKIS